MESEYYDMGGQGYNEAPHANMGLQTWLVRQIDVRREHEARRIVKARQIEGYDDENERIYENFY